AWSTPVYSVDIFGLVIEAATGGGTPAPEAIYVEVLLSSGSTGTALDLEDAFPYAAIGYQGVAPTSQPVTYYKYGKKKTKWVTKEENFFTKGVATALPPATTTPEPGTVALLATGLMGL